MADTACAGAQLPGTACAGIAGAHRMRQHRLLRAPHARASAPGKLSTPRRAFGRPKFLEHAERRPLDGHGNAAQGLARDLGPQSVRRPRGLRSSSLTLNELPDLKSLATEAPTRRGLTGRLVGDSFTSPELPQMGRAISEESGAAEVFLGPPDPYGLKRTYFGARAGPRVSFVPPSRTPSRVEAAA
ncbi:unnamed protein product [Prorocentrum cordatum]|uniref:Uncharacterized protein n=1 Tax=Prorocentrum cordatum TaxID=2364126 RepID=A0ABN9RJT6_9DINO|nr:unnamed protein product [Polarella glacialis]